MGQGKLNAGLSSLGRSRCLSPWWLSVKVQIGGAGLRWRRMALDFLHQTEKQFWYGVHISWSVVESCLRNESESQTWAKIIRIPQKVREMSSRRRGLRWRINGYEWLSPGRVPTCCGFFPRGVCRGVARVGTDPTLVRRSAPCGSALAQTRCPTYPHTSASVGIRPSVSLKDRAWREPSMASSIAVTVRTRSLSAQG